MKLITFFLFCQVYSDPADGAGERSGRYRYRLDDKDSKLQSQVTSGLEVLIRILDPYSERTDLCPAKI